ncbi:hypothetical protein BKA70DRAFT_1130952 [Coprinopsis sp. MPI-PUGE-AT-0042]|nr:hypothetical protein BKA70DRAFT_1130952 [Coprinopsis sp. MPI-PUGE-AT-0042]
MPEAFNLDEAHNDLGCPPQEDDIMVEPHPKSKERPRYYTYNSYSSSLPKPDKTSGPKRRRQPWSPFLHRSDFELAEFMRATNLNIKQMDRLLHIVGNISKGAGYSLVDARHVTETWDSSAKDFNTHMDKKTITVPYRDEDYKFDVWAFDLWDWVLQLLHDPVYISQMRWDALRLFHHNGHTFERFINEPWTANQWWQVQDNLPDGGFPFCIILYADKTKLSSIGTAKGYPVYARDGNLPIDIRNSDGFAGGRMVALLPIVEEEADKAGKPSFINFKNLVWHESFRRILKRVAVFSQSGCKVHCGDGLWRIIFPLILILSADFEEQCVMANTRGSRSNFPCPVCLVPTGEQWRVSTPYPLRTSEEHAATYAAVAKMSAEDREKDLKALGLRFVINVFWAMGYTDIYRALCWDRLHAYHGGLFSDHILKEFLDLLDDSDTSKRSLRTMVELALFPHWRDLNHFKELSKIKEFSDGRKYEDLSKVLIYAAHNALDESLTGSRRGFWLLRLTCAYLELDMYASLRNHTETTLRQGRQALLKWEEMLKEYQKVATKGWNFPKAHTHAHLFDDIEAKGVTRNSNTKPNEQLHGVLKEYYDNTNFKNVNEKIARFQSWDLAMAIINENIERHDSSLALLQEDEDATSEVALRHLTVGSPIPDPVHEAIKVKNVFKHVPEAFRGALAPSDLLKKIRGCLKHSTEQTHQNFNVYHYAKVNYASLEDASVATDFLRMNQKFHDQERYDSCLIDVDGRRQVFAQMVVILGMMVSGQEVLLLVLIPYDDTLTEASGAATRAKARRDEAFEFIRVRQRLQAKAVVVFAETIIRGALLVKDFSNEAGRDFLVVDIVDADMFMRMKRDRHLLATNVSL